MNVSELYELPFWVDENIVKVEIPQKYQKLLQVVQQNTQPNQTQQPIDEQKRNLIDTIRIVPLNQLTREQLEFLQALEIAQAVGDEAVETINDIFYKNAIDIATAAQKVQEIHQKLSNGIKKLNQIKGGLEGSVHQETYEAENEVLMRITFTGDAELTNIVKFRDWGKTWYEIGRGIAIAHDATPEQVKIIGATSGSIVIEMATIASIAGTTAGIIFSALKLAEKVLDIRKKAEEIKNLQLQNKKLATDLVKEADNEKEEGIKNISLEIVAELDINKTKDGEKINALDRSIKLLVDFIESGGEVDFIVPENDETEVEGEDEEYKPSEYKKLKDNIEQIHLLESKLKLLGS